MADSNDGIVVSETTTIITNKGPFRAHKLINETFHALVHGEEVQASVSSAGKVSISTLFTEEGYSVQMGTGNMVKVEDSREWVQIELLKPGDVVVLAGCQPINVFEDDKTRSKIEEGKKEAMRMYLSEDAVEYNFERRWMRKSNEFLYGFLCQMFKQPDGTTGEGGRLHLFGKDRRVIKLAQLILLQAGVVCSEQLCKSWDESTTKHCLLLDHDNCCILNSIFDPNKSKLSNKKEYLKSIATTLGFNENHPDLIEIATAASKNSSPNVANKFGLFSTPEYKSRFRATVKEVVCDSNSQYAYKCIMEKGSQLNLNGIVVKASENQ